MTQKEAVDSVRLVAKDGSRAQEGTIQDMSGMCVCVAFKHVLLPLCAPIKSMGIHESQQLLI